MSIRGLLAAGMILAVTSSPGLAQESPFGKPSIDYLKSFQKSGSRVFVLERYEANGSLFSRDVQPLAKPIEVKGAVERKINGVDYRLRGLKACPNKTVTYQTEQWGCDKAAIDSQSMIYGRASVTLCKTLALKTTSGKPDPVSCFSLVGDGSSNDPYNVNYDDDDVVFLGFASIGKNDKGQPLRPDLEKSAELGNSMGNTNGQSQ